MTLSHIDKNGKANMVDVGNKQNQIREARAKGFIELSDETVKLISENQMKTASVHRCRNCRKQVTQKAPGANTFGQPRCDPTRT
jgi:molybdenum cofactor biosynthesis enzyme